ncbi:F-box family protein with DUF295 [Prunus dulcis]|uniref:F-box family protein with DUF295 n=1 Tax=Prunus dulcis TaxID=3755 RepID=A0A4Y1R653_PRUDU|nr:F-box family protein with DUF295 [Prunus dulcis]
MKSDRCLRTSSLIIVQSVHLTLPHEFRGRSDRECQDLRLGRLGVPRPARIAARLTLCPRDLPGLRIRLTTVPCILPERLELTWCHRGICRRDRLIISNEVLKDFELSLFKDDFQPFYIGLSVIAHKCIGSTTGPLLTSTLQSQVKFWDWSKYRGDSAEFSAEVEEKFEKNLRQKGHKSL